MNNLPDKFDPTIGPELDDEQCRCGNLAAPDSDRCDDCEEERKTARHGTSMCEDTCSFCNNAKYCKYADGGE